MALLPGDIGRQLHSHVGEWAARVCSAWDSFGGFVRNGPGFSRHPIASGVLPTSASAILRPTRSATPSVGFRGSSGPYCSRKNDGGKSAHYDLQSPAHPSNSASYGHIDAGNELAEDLDSFSGGRAAGRTAGHASTSGRKSDCSRQHASARQGLRQKRRCCKTAEATAQRPGMEASESRRNAGSGHDRLRNQTEMHSDGSVVSHDQQTGRSLMIPSDSGVQQSVKAQPLGERRGEGRAYTVTEPAEPGLEVASHGAIVQLPLNQRGPHGNVHQEPTSWQVRWRGKKPKPWLVSSSRTAEELGDYTWEEEDDERKSRVFEPDNGNCTSTVPREARDGQGGSELACNSRVASPGGGRDDKTRVYTSQFTGSKGGWRTEVMDTGAPGYRSNVGGIVIEEIKAEGETCQNHRVKKDLPKWLQPLLGVKAKLDEIHKEVMDHVGSFAENLVQHLPWVRPPLHAIGRRLPTNKPKQQVERMEARAKAGARALSSSSTFQDIQQGHPVEAAQNRADSSCEMSWEAQGSDRGEGEWALRAPAVEIPHRPGRSSEGFDRIQSGMRQPQILEEENARSGRGENSSAGGNSRALRFREGSQWRTAVVRRQTPQLWLRPKSSLVLSMLYNSRTSEVDAVVSSQGARWRLDATLGDLLGRARRGRSRRGPPVWEAQVAGVVLQPDTALVPIHASPHHVLWYGYNHKRDVHLARALVNPWSKDWQAEGSFTLKPWSCLYWSLRFPYGHVLWSASMGVAGSVFTPALGGLLQASGSFAKEGTVSYERRVRRLGTTVRPKISLPEGAVSLEVEQEILSERRGWLQRPLCDARFVHTVNGRDRGRTMEVGYEPREWLRLSGGVQSGRQSRAYGCLSFGRSKRAPDGRGRSLNGPAVKLRLEAPPENFRRAVFTVEVNKCWQF